MAAASDEQFASEIATLYRKCVVIDTQGRPFTRADSLPDQAAIQAVQQSGMTAINFTVSGWSFEETVQRLAYVDALVEQWPDVFTVIRIHADIARAKREGKLGIMPGFQYTSFLEADPSRIEMFRRLGVRIMHLTYNNRGIFGDGCLEPATQVLAKQVKA